MPSNAAESSEGRKLTLSEVSWDQYTLAAVRAGHRHARDIRLYVRQALDALQHLRKARLIRYGYHPTGWKAVPPMTPAGPRVVEREIGAIQVVDPREFGPGVTYVGRQRQHHDEATEALVVEALQEAQVRIYCQRVDGCPQDGHTCPNCRAINKIAAALKVLGK